MDLYGDSAVWGDAPSLSSSTSTAQPTISTTHTSLFAPPKDDPFDDFDEFGETSAAPPTQAMEDDDFGDFEDFTQDPGATNAEGTEAFNNDGFEFSDSATFSDVVPAMSKPLQLDPMPNLLDLTQQVGELLDGLVKGPHVDESLTGEGIKQIDGPTQLLVTQERCVSSNPYFF